MTNVVSQLASPLSIGAIGWWNYDNQGDIAMLAALEKGLAPHKVIPIDTGFAMNQDAIYRLNRLDYLLLGGGTLIPGRPTTPFDTFEQWANQLESPLGIVGLGVDPIFENYWPAVEALLDRAQFIFVRDQSSRKLLRNHHKVQVAPDLTFAYPLHPTEYVPEDNQVLPVCGLNLRRSASLDPALWLTTLAKMSVKVRGIPFSSFESWEENALHRQLDPASCERFDPKLYRNLDFVIGTAFHSILFAVQTAVPVIAINYAPKVANFIKEIGLAHYLLGPDEHHKLPELVAELLANRSNLVSELNGIREKLCREARQNLNSVLKQIQKSDPRHLREGAQATIIVIGSENSAKDERTLSSCTSQTYKNLEIVYTAKKNILGLANMTNVTHVAIDRHFSFNELLRIATDNTNGKYLTWINGGDRLSIDAVDCLVKQLEEEQQRDVVYADLFVTNEHNRIVEHQAVPGSNKLFRRNVIGPCFLTRKSLLEKMKQSTADAPLNAYDLWLRASPQGQITPFHVPLLYTEQQLQSPEKLKQERLTRRVWRRNHALWNRVVWRIVDTDLVEYCVVKPVAYFLRFFKGRLHVEPR